MDYLSFLPFELWDQIIQECISLSVAGPPMDPMSYARLDEHLMDRKGRYLLSDIIPRLRLVCRAFHQIVGEDRTNHTPPVRQVVPQVFPTRLRRAPEALEDDMITGDFDTIMETAAQLCRREARCPGMQTIHVTERKWYEKKTVREFWPTIASAFPNLVSLFIHCTRSVWLPKPASKDSKDKVSLPHLRNLYMQSVVCDDLPFMPQLRYCAMNTVDGWDNVYEKMPNLQVLHILGSPLTRFLPPPPPTLLCLRCSLADVGYLGYINSRRNFELQSLVLFVPSDPIRGGLFAARGKSAPYPEQVASSVERASQVCPSKEIRLLLFSQYHSEQGRAHIVHSCLTRGIQVETTPRTEKGALEKAALYAKRESEPSISAPTGTRAGVKAAERPLYEIVWHSPGPKLD